MPYGPPYTFLLIDVLHVCIMHSRLLPGRFLTKIIYPIERRTYLCRIFPRQSSGKLCYTLCLQSRKLYSLLFHFFFVYLVQSIVVSSNFFFRSSVFFSMIERPLFFVSKNRKRVKKKKKQLVRSVKP